MYEEDYEDDDELEVDEDEVEVDDDVEEEDAEGEEEQEEEEIDEEEIPKYSQKNLTKIISAKHNKMKKQFLAKTQEYNSQMAAKLEEAEAVVSWVAANSKLSKAEILAQIGFTPSGKGATLDAKMFDTTESATDDEAFNAEVNEMRSKAKRYPGYKENEKMIVEYAKDTGLPVVKAYWAMMGENATKAARKAGADEVLFKKKAKASKATESGTGRMPKATQFSKEDKLAAQQSGMDVAEYVKYKNMDSIDDFYKSKKRK